MRRSATNLKKKRKQQGISTEKLVSISTTTFKHKTPPSKKNKTVMKGQPDDHVKHACWIELSSVVIFKFEN